MMPSPVRPTSKRGSGTGHARSTGDRAALRAMFLVTGGESLKGGIGNILMHHDSEIINRVMLHFAERGVVTLPVHDSLIVPLKYLPECRAAMNAAFKEEFKQDTPITGWLLEGILDALDKASSREKKPGICGSCPSDGL